MEAYNGGYKVFGENKPQEMTGKYNDMPKDIEWHMIGHLQTNKVKYIAPYVSLVHSVDSFKLLKTIDKEAEKSDRVIDCLMQMHIAQEDTKFGLSLEELEAILKSFEYKELKHIRVVGLMGMATFTNDNDQIRNEFKTLKLFYDKVKLEYFDDKDYFKEISMGMSGDYEIAIEEGSTMIRVGSSIFGSRVYNK